ncbi:hypothetical protein D3C85_1845870 [compost metagenome]
MQPHAKTCIIVIRSNRVVFVCSEELVFIKVLLIVFNRGTLAKELHAPLNHILNSVIAIKGVISSGGGRNA